MSIEDIRWDYKTLDGTRRHYYLLEVNPGFGSRAGLSNGFFIKFAYTKFSTTKI